MYYLKAKDIHERTDLIRFLSDKANVGAVFHYIPLHSAPAGLKFGRFDGEDVYTTRESERLLRDMLARFLTSYRLVDDAGAVLDHDDAVDRLHSFLVEIMPVTGSMQWRVGRADGSNGLRALGVDETGYCERTEKPRLARWPKGDR